MKHKTLQLLLLAAILAITAGGGVFAGEKKAKDKTLDNYYDLLHYSKDAAWDEARKRIYVSCASFVSFSSVNDRDSEKEGDKAQETYSEEEMIVVVNLPKSRFDLAENYYLPNISVSNPRGILLLNDTLYIVDYEGDSVIAYDLNIEQVVAGYPFNVPDKSIQPTSICADNIGTLYVVDQKGYRIFSKSSSSQTFTELELSGDAIIEPAGMYYDADKNRILICEYSSSNAAIKAINLDNDSVYTALQTNISKFVGITYDGRSKYYISCQHERVLQGGITNAGGDIYKIDTSFTGGLIPWLVNVKGLQNISCLPGRDTILIPFADKIYVEALYDKAPELYYPANNAVGRENDIDFKWEKISFANIYHFQLSDTSSFKKPKYDLYLDEKSNVHTILNLDLNKQYYWRLRAESEFVTVNSEWSEVRTFTTSDSVVEGPETLYPPLDSVGLPDEINFQWRAVPGAGEYHIQVSRTPYFTRPEYDYYVTTNSVSLKSLNLGQDYYWRVKGVGGLRGTIWSETAAFNTAEPTLATPVLLEPYTHRAELPMNLELIWDSVANASYYVIQIEPIDPYFYQPFGGYIDDSLSNVMYSLYGLEAQGTFRWRVKAKNANSSSAWSQEWQFNITDTAITPPNSMWISQEGGNDLTPIFYWNDKKGDNYDIQAAEYISNDKKLNFINPAF